MFYCNKCGECCRNLDKVPEFAEMHKGDGICNYLDGDLCTIYEKRPLFCRVDEGYEAYFKDLMTKEEYERLNLESCEMLKNNI